MSYTPVKDTNHEGRGVARLLEQFRRSGNLQAILRSYLRQLQRVEDAAWEVIEKRNLVDGFGVILDNIGRIVGRGREDLDDDHYRIAIRAQIRINRSQGKPKDFTDVAVLATPEGTEHTFTALAKTIIWEVLTPLEFVLAYEILFKSLAKVKAAGDQLFFLFSLEGLTVDDTFTLAEYDPTSYNDLPPVYDDLKGLSSQSDDIGGALLMVVST